MAYFKENANKQNSNLVLNSVLLWENEVGSQTVFSTETISLDLSKYNAVIVRFNEYLNRRNNPDVYVIVPKGLSTYACGVGTLSGTQAGVRLITALTDTSITIGDAYFKTDKNNSIIIPNAIYGVNIAFS